MKVLSFSGYSGDVRGAKVWGNQRVIALVAGKGRQADRGVVHQQLAHRRVFMGEEVPAFNLQTHLLLGSSPRPSGFRRLLSLWDLQGHHCRFSLEVLVET